MRKPGQDKIPVSILKYTTVNADFSSLNGVAKILYLNPKCVLIGLDEIPYMLFLTPDFDKEGLIREIGESLYEIKRLVLQATFSYVSPAEREYCKISEWLICFKKIEVLKFDYVELDDLWLLRNLPVKHLIFKNIKFNDPDVFLDSLAQFGLLNEITHDDSISQEVIKKIAASKPSIKLSYEAE